MANRRRWTCPECGSGWAIPAGAADPEVCPRCRDAQAAVPEFDPDAVFRQFEFRIESPGRLQAATHLRWGDLFDWSFKRYLTPLLIQLAWMMFVGMALIGIAYSAVDFAAILVTERPLTKLAGDWLDDEPAQGPRGGAVAGSDP